MMLTILKKDLRLYFSDKKGIIVTFLLPIIMITLFAFAFGGVGKKKNAPKPLGVLVVDKDSTEAKWTLNNDGSMLGFSGIGCR
mgnify:CR=1 FL=1